MTKHDETHIPSSDRTALEIEITERMIQHGVAAFGECHYGDDPREIVESIYLAMSFAKDQS